MVMTYRRPGVYLEESLLVNPSDVSGTITVGCFVGVAQKGQLNSPVLVESWSDFVTQFGSFDVITPPSGDPITTQVLSFLPYAVFSFFQNGGRLAYVIRSAPTTALAGGTAATIAVNGSDATATPLVSFNLTAKSVGAWGNSLQYGLVKQSTVGSGSAAEDVFAIQVLLKNADGVYEVVETFTGLSVTGNPAGTRRIDAVINDAYSGSRYVQAINVNPKQKQPVITNNPVALAGGVDPGIPDAAALISSATKIGSVEGPINLNIVGYLKDAASADTTTAASNWVSATVPSSTFPDREDVMIINDSAPPRQPGQDSSAYSTTVNSTLGANTGDSYSASYGPWIIIPDPRRIGTTISVPPGGAVAGMIARIDATVGVFRAPAGIVADLSNAVGVQTKFSDTELGDLNSRNINIIRPVVPDALLRLPPHH